MDPYGPIHICVFIYGPIMDPFIYVHVIYTYIYTAPHPAPASGAQAGIYIAKNDSDSIIVAGNRVKAMLYDSDMKAMILICIL